MGAEIGGSVEATTMSAIAASVSAVIGAASATIAAISAWNSSKSATASETALRETRDQRRIDNARTWLNELGSVYDQAMAFISAIAVERRREPALVERGREALRRSLMIAGLASPAFTRLVEANEPLTNEEISAVRDEFTRRSAALHAVLTGVADAMTESACGGDATDA